MLAGNYSSNAPKRASASSTTKSGAYVRDAGFAVPLSGPGSETQGVVLTHQARMLDWSSRSPRFVEIGFDATMP